MISCSSTKLIKNGIAPLPFPPRAAKAILVHIARGEGQGEGTCSILCNVRVYVAGETYYVGSSPTNNDIANHWIVRRSMDGGLTWSLVDDFEPGSMETRPVGITLDKAGNVYVVGMAAQAGSGEVWTVRKGTSGTSFATVDIYSGPYGSQAEAIYADPTGGIFAVGSAPIPGTNRPPAKNNSWIVRRSRDGGATWAIVDTFQLTRNWSSRAFGVGADALG